MENLNSTTSRKYNFIKVFIILIITNVVGFILKGNELPTYVILLGFRFHLSLILPGILIIFFDRDFSLVIQTLKEIEYKKFIQIILITILPVGILLGSLFLLNKIEFNTPDYLYEFGYTSLVDFPIYLIWNFPQLFSFYLFQKYIRDNFNYKFMFVFFSSLLLIFFEIIPLTEFKFNYNIFLIILLLLIAVSLFIVNIKNIYFFAFSIFIILWNFIIAFGSKSELLINLLFAKNYDKWEGFFTINKSLKKYFSVNASQLSFGILIYFLLFIIFLSILIITKNNLKKLNVKT